MYIEVTPAYGRDYTTAKAVKADWKAGKDFIICCMFHPDNGRYINKEDADKDPSLTVNLRYDELRKVTNA
jgi:hypothetical protein